VIKRYHDPATPFARALAHPQVTRAVKARLREMHRALDPVALLAEMRAAQTELGERIGRRPGKMAVRLPAPSLQQMPLPRGSASLSRRASRAARTGGRNETMSGESAHRRCLTRTSP
jgi:hypothetical protein